MLCQKIEVASQTNVPSGVFSKMDKKNHPSILKVITDSICSCFIEHFVLINAYIIYYNHIKEKIISINHLRLHNNVN